MEKSPKELAAEMTIAWMNAVSNALDKLPPSWLDEDSVVTTYKKFYNAICNPQRPETE